jgi:hypothetical protein
MLFRKRSIKARKKERNIVSKATSRLVSRVDKMFKKKVFSTQRPVLRTQTLVQNWQS